MAYIKLGLCYLLGIFFVLAGVMHFVNPGFYIPMMPEYLPLHEELVFLSGIAEIIAGVLVLIPKTRQLGGWSVITVLLAVYPANIHMAYHPDEFTDFMPRAGLYLRLPLQIVAIAWAWWVTRPKSNKDTNISISSTEEATQNEDTHA